MKIAFIGNDTKDVIILARYLVTDKGFTKMSMLDGIHRVVRSLYFVGGYQALRWHQQYAMYDALYSVDPTVWVKYLDYRLSKATNDIILTDIRYSSEAKLLTERGFKIIRIVSTNVKGNKGKIIAAKREGQTPLDGTILLQEAYPGKMMPYKVSYSITHNNLEATKKVLDRIVVDNSE
jgi:hypothetical protein